MIKRLLLLSWKKGGLFCLYILEYAVTEIDDSDYEIFFPPNILEYSMNDLRFAVICHLFSRRQRES